MIEGAQYIEGKVALRYHQPIPKLFNINGKDLMTDVRSGVSLLLVEEADVPSALAHSTTCCGNQKKMSFSLATELAVKVWRDGQY